ncbi:hypothetical protein H6F97_25250 [Microcoleus sp. FACHB-1]|nr:hypothetical protein [Microcoleus sp. FACHB-1]
MNTAVPLYVILSLPHQFYFHPVKGAWFVGSAEGGVVMRGFLLGRSLTIVDGT